jgi:hypothetical protein
MTNRLYLLGCTIGCLLFLAGPVGLAQTLQVINAEGHSTAVTTAQIAGLPHIVVDVLDHGKPAQFEGLPLAALLSMAGIQLGRCTTWTTNERSVAGRGS